MNDIEILEHLEKMQKTFIEDGLQGYEMVIVNTKNLIENLIQRNKDLEQIEKEHKEENGRLSDKIKELEIEKENEFKRGFFTKVNESHKHTIKIESQVIPKMKLREIVDLYNNTLQCTRKYNEELANILCDLEELLEESEK